jgi:hypothetical protein
MTTEPKNLNPYLTEFVAAAKTVLQNAEEAAELYATGDARGACNAVNVMHYKTGQLEDLRLALVRDFDEQGFKPGLDVGG